MAAPPSYYGSGAGVTGIGDVTLTPVTGHQKYDYAIALIQTANQAIPSIPTGWESIGALVGTGTPGTLGSTGITLIGRRFTSSAEGGVIIPDSGDHQHGKMAIFRGCTKTAQPWTVLASGSDGTLDAAITIALGSSVAADSLIAIFAVSSIDSGIGNHYSGEVAAGITGLAERFDSAASTGTGGGIALWTGTKSAAGALGTFTATIDTATVDAWYVVALKPYIPPITVGREFSSPYAEANPGAGGALTPMGAGPTGIILCGSDLGGAYISTDDGVTWNCIGLSRGMATPHIRSIGFDPVVEGVLYLGSEHGIYRSINTGLAWALVSPDVYVTSVEPARSNPLTVYAAAAPLYNSSVAQIYKSTDRGATWALLSTNLPATGLRITKLRVDPTNENTLWVVSANDLFTSSAGFVGPLVYALYKSTDGGTTWVQKGAAAGNAWDFAVDPVVPSTVWLTTWAGVIYSAYTGQTWKSTDGGDTFVSKSAHTGAVVVKANGTSVLVMDTARDPGHVEEGAWESTNGGTSWTQISVIADYDAGWQPAAQWAYGRNLYSTAASLGQDLSDPNVIFMTNAQFNYRSDDWGLVFDNTYTNQVSLGFWRTRGLECICTEDVVWSKANPDIIFIGDFDIGLWRSEDQGQSWQSCNVATFTGAWNGYGGSAMSILLDPVRPNVVWTTMGETSLLADLVKSIDYGRPDSWALSNTGLPTQVFMKGLSLDQNSSSTNRTLFLCAGPNGDVYKSTNDGATWSAVLSGHNLYLTAVDAINSNLVYAGGVGGLWRSLDGGTVWAQIGDAAFTGSLGTGTLAGMQWTGIQWIAIDPQVTGRVYVAAFGSGKGVYSSDDSGATWTQLRSGTYWRAIAVDPTDSNRLLITSSKAYKSGGVPLTSEGILRSINRGTSWRDINDGLAWKFAGPVAINPANPTKFIVGSPGNGFWIRELLGEAMTLTDAKIYIARVTGAQGDTNKLALAGDAIKATAAKWDTIHDWSFTLKDNAVAPISIAAGVTDYNAPTDFKVPYTARLLTTKRTLTYIEQRYFDRTIWDQTPQTYTDQYTLFNSAGWSPGAQETVIRLLGSPDTVDQLLLRYYRKINPVASSVDIPDNLLYIFLDDCKCWFLAQSNSTDPRLPTLQALSNRAVADAVAADKGTPDQDLCMTSQIEMFRSHGYDPTMDIG